MKWALPDKTSAGLYAGSTGKSGTRTLDTFRMAPYGAGAVGSCQRSPGFIRGCRWRFASDNVLQEGVGCRGTKAD